MTAPSTAELPPWSDEDEAAWQELHRGDDDLLWLFPDEVQP